MCDHHRFYADQRSGAEAALSPVHELAMVTSVMLRIPMPTNVNMDSRLKDKDKHLHPCVSVRGTKIMNETGIHQPRKINK